MVGRLRWPSWFLPDHARPLPTLFTLTQRPSNDLTRLPNALSTTALHSRPLPIVLNSSNQPGTVGDTSTKFTDLPGPSKTHPRSFPTFLRLHKTSPDHQGRERSAVRSAKCDRGFINYANPVYGVSTIYHQVRCLSWGHSSLFHTATSFFIWYKMFRVRDISYRLIWMKFINMLSVYAQSGTHRGFNWWIIAVLTENPSVLMPAEITDAPKL